MDQDFKNIISPLVSITMVTYNRAHFIREAIASVISQTYQNWELIIVDDGSTDNTRNIVAAFEDKRIVYTRHAHNTGILIARNEALSRADGEFVAVLDSDDVWLDKEKLAHQVAFLQSHTDHVLVGTFIMRIDSNGNELGTTTYATDDTRIRTRILLRNQFAHSSVLMRKSALLKTEGYRENLAEDLDLFLQLGMHGKLANLGKAMTGYRIHGNGASAQRIQMARAIGKILARHAHAYPHALIARIKNYLRFLKVLTLS